MTDIEISGDCFSGKSPNKSKVNFETNKQSCIKYFKFTIVVKFFATTPEFPIYTNTLKKQDT